ncbi:DUF6687 family protein [Rufibacter glacialis]|uniref:DUF6687 family protein n=1 Tax=Rufibacter glacialis TaxID=1259555 RepID=A0A5M8Q5H8_9BACT|nr:DUF6687 family protein [Rufibacter glacialis]KAA6430603.1 hypothetical protein FOE74_19195 [Rufibacter glacialis]GGK85106.1 hypothetical protein GCM10011405_36150 [Rufibacter glacialis]
MQQFTYLPFPQIKNTPAVVVDSFHPNGLVLSHWREAPTPAALREDTSAGMVLQALKQEWPDLKKYQFVTANHFDIDALVGVWALLHPELALAHEETLRQMAIIGDFRELDLEAPQAMEALQLVCWINSQEKERFYPPFGAEELEENEVTASIPKFHYFLEKFDQVLVNPALFRPEWEAEVSKVLEGYRQVHGSESKIIQVRDLGLVIIDTPAPVHYYALFSATAGYDLVVSCYPGQRYEVEAKYTTWVDLDSRPALPRPDFRPLASLLTTLETSDFVWTADGITDTGPLLRLEGAPLTKAQRYGNPFERTIYPSSISQEKFLQTVTGYLKNAFSKTAPKKNWTWAQMKAWQP